MYFLYRTVFGLYYELCCLSFGAVLILLFIPTSFSAGLGVLSMAVQAVSRMAGTSGAAAKNPFFLLDKDVTAKSFFFKFLLSFC